MRTLLQALFHMPVRAGETALGRIMSFFVACYVFSAIPDIDLLFIGILHHRSIVTHSVLPGLIFLLLGRSLGAAPAAGAMVGLSVHLAADTLSPNMTGFAMVWTPAPWKVGLGDFSYIWLASNSVLAAYLAFILMPNTRRSVISVLLILMTGASAAGVYGYFNEGSVLAIVAATVSMLLGYHFFRHHTRHPLKADTNKTPTQRR